MSKVVTKGKDIPLDQIKPSPYQPRLTFDLEDIKGSIMRDGILVTLTVRKKDGYYEMVDGERRWRVAKELGYETVPCDVIDIDDDTARRMVWKVNTLRKDYEPKEKAMFFKKMQEEYGMSLKGIAREYDTGMRTVNAYLNVFKLPDEYRQMVWDGVIPVRNIRELQPLFNGVARATPNNNPEIFEMLDRSARERHFGAEQIREAIKPTLAKLREERVEKAKEALAEVKPEVEVPETPEELEEAAKALIEEAKKRKTPEQKHQELVDKAQKALSSFPSLEKAEKLGIGIKPYKEKLEKIEGYLKESPEDALDKINSLKKEFKAEIKEAEIRREEEEKRRREEEMRRRIEEEAKRRARELEEAERRRIEEEARKKAQEEILSSPELLQEVVQRAREERYQEFAEMERRAREAAQGIVQPLGEALLKAEQDAKIARTSEQRKLLENYMLLGSIIQSLKSKKIFCIDHPDDEPILVWSCGIPITKTHKELEAKLRLNK